MALATPTTRLLTDADVRSVFDWVAAVEALRVAYSPQDDVRRYLRSMARGDGVWLRTLSGVAADGSLMGAKLIAASVRGRRASYLIPLFRQETAELAALLDGIPSPAFARQRRPRSRLTALRRESRWPSA